MDWMNLGHFLSAKCAAAKDFFFFTFTASTSVSPLVFCGREASPLHSDEDQRESVLLLPSTGVVLMSPGTDTAGSGHGPTETAHYIYMMIWDRLRE